MAILVKGNAPTGLVFGWMATWQNVELSVHLSPGGELVQYSHSGFVSWWWNAL